jgi:hypothetical protein
MKRRGVAKNGVTVIAQWMKHVEVKVQPPWPPCTAVGQFTEIGAKNRLGKKSMMFDLESDLEISETTSSQVPGSTSGHERSERLTPGQVVGKTEYVDPGSTKMVHTLFL